MSHRNKTLMLRQAFEMVQQRMDDQVKREPVDDESLAMLAMGRGSELPAAERDRLLRRIAADPDLANLLTELCRIDWSELEQHARPISGKPRVSMRFPIIALRSVWGLAACLVLVLGLQQVVTSPSTVDPWSVSKSPIQGTVEPASNVGPILFWTGVGALVVLTPMVVWTGRRRRPRP